MQHADNQNAYTEVVDVKLGVIGGVTGGASTAARVRRLDPSAEIVLFERGRDVSFSNCALPYRLSDIVESSDDLILMDQERGYGNRQKSEDRNRQKSEDRKKQKGQI